MMEKVLIKVYFKNEFVGLEVFTDEKKFLRYVERHEYIDGKRNYIMQDVDCFKLLGSKVLFKKVLEYFKGIAKVKFIYLPSERKSFFAEVEKHFDYADTQKERANWSQFGYSLAIFSLGSIK